MPGESVILAQIAYLINFPTLDYLKELHDGGSKSYAAQISGSTIGIAGSHKHGIEVTTSNQSSQIYNQYPPPKGVRNVPHR
jgi:hypothetical protein